MRSASARWRCRDYIDEHHEPEIGDIEIAAARRDQGSGGPLWRGAVHREGRLRPDPRGGWHRRAVRHRADVTQGHERHRGAHAGRGAVRAARPAARTSCTISTSAASAIKQTLHTSDRRYTFQHKIETVSTSACASPTSSGSRARAAARIRDASTSARRARPRITRARLRINGATEAEIEFLLRGEGKTGQRVELNAMTSDQFVAFVERKLTEHRRGQGGAGGGNAGRNLCGVQARRDGAGRRSKPNWRGSTPSRSTSPPISLSGCAPISTSIRNATWDAAVRAVVEDSEDEDGEIGDRS